MTNRVQPRLFPVRVLNRTEMALERNLWVVKNWKCRKGCDRRTFRASDATHNPPAPVGLTSNYLIFSHIPNYFHPHICSEHSRSIVGYSHWYRPTLCSTLYNIDGVIYVGEKNSPDFLSIDTRNIYILANKEEMKMVKHVLEHREDDNHPGYWYLVVFDDEKNSIEKVTALCERDIYEE